MMSRIIATYLRIGIERVSLLSVWGRDMGRAKSVGARIHRQRRGKRGEGEG